MPGPKPNKPYKPLIPREPMAEIIPYVSGISMDLLRVQLEELTGKGCATLNNMTYSPRGEHPQTAETGTGSRVVLYSPYQSMRLKVTVNGQKTEMDIYFFIRERDRQSPMFSRALELLAKDDEKDDEISYQVTISKETQRKRPRRDEVPTEKEVFNTHEAREVLGLNREVLGSRDLIVRYFKRRFQTSQLDPELFNDIKNLNWNFCHLLGFALAYDALLASGQKFDTQKVRNILAGTRAINEAVYPIENTLLDFMKKEQVTEILYMGTCVPFKRVHAMSSLTLAAVMKTTDGREVAFSQGFNPFETRIVSGQVTTAVSCFMRVAMTMELPEQAAAAVAAGGRSPSLENSVDSGDESGSDPGMTSDDPSPIQDVPVEQEPLSIADLYYDAGPMPAAFIPGASLFQLPQDDDSEEEAADHRVRKALRHELSNGS